ncbi:MAG: hypothetical protein AAB441_03860 [Patescibacteria group bacterium]
MASGDEIIAFVEGVVVTATAGALLYYGLIKPLLKNKQAGPDHIEYSRIEYKGPPLAQETTVKFSPHQLSRDIKCPGGTSKATLKSFTAFRAIYQGLCPGICGASRPVEIRLK